MVEMAFRAVKGGELYNKYFKAQAEKQKFYDLARDFFVRNNLLDGGSFCEGSSLILELTDDQVHRFSGQLRKDRDKNGMYIFKKNSKMQKSWNKEVTDNVDLKEMIRLRMWYYPYIKSGRQALWSYNGCLYGYLSDSHEESIRLTDDMEQIQLSEYYRIREEAESEQKRSGTSGKYR